MNSVLFYASELRSGGGPLLVHAFAPCSPIPPPAAPTLAGALARATTPTECFAASAQSGTLEAPRALNESA